MERNFIGRVRRLATVTCLTLLATFGSANQTKADEKIASPIVDLDASGLSPGAVGSWSNAGSAGGSFAPVDQPPTVKEIAGRKAVSFDAGSPLKSSSPVPEELVKGKPFTIAVWAYLPEVQKREVIASWASRPNGSAEFSYGAGNDGAFFGWDRTIRYAALPKPSAWHYLAWQYDGTNTAVFIDGIADVESPGKLLIKAGGSILIGAGWDGTGKKPTFPFKGAVSRVQVWPRALGLREIRLAGGWKGPYAPTPADGSVPPAESLKLSWQAGTDGAQYSLRLAETEPALADSATAIPVSATEFTPKPLTPGKAYVWRVDQVDASGRVIEQGPVWRFSTDNGPASTPWPRHQVAGVSPETRELKWTPGRYATSQTIYFGTNAETVANGSTEHASVDAKASTWTPTIPKLDHGKTYFWRVESQNGSISPARGEVWAFRTADELTKNDVTFFVSSDTHYGLGNNAELNRKVIREMNWLPGKPMPSQVGGGTVPTPRGVILDGDLLDKGFEPKTAPAAWAAFCRDYGLSGSDGKLGYPVYEGFGNHDGMTGKSFSRAGVKERNPKRVRLTAISPNGFHYSWDWDNVHLVQLNLFPGKDSADCIVGPANHHPEDSLGFLKEDLATRVGNSGKIVIVFCHFCYAGGMADWWTEQAKDRFRETVKGYRTLLIHGHSHGAYFYEWKGLRAISDGSTARPDSQTGDFLVVRITPTDLIVAQRKLDSWGITLKEPLPAVDRSSADQKAAAAK